MTVDPATGHPVSGTSKEKGTARCGPEVRSRLKPASARLLCAAELRNVHPAFLLDVVEMDRIALPQLGERHPALQLRRLRPVEIPGVTLLSLDRHDAGVLVDLRDFPFVRLVASVRGGRHPEEQDPRNSQ